jgi:DMSO/TMAO reductase YedYZ molybdopterin-dependent catalytic subunit
MITLMNEDKERSVDSAPQNPGRRRMLVGSAGALASVSLLGMTRLTKAEEAKTLPDYARWKDQSALIVHSANTLETRRDAIGSGVITPGSRLYVRNNLPAPSNDIVANADAWEVSFKGVNNPKSLTLADLKKIGVESVAAVLQCSGNGRGFFKHGPGGTQWTVGAAGCVMWTGVPLRDVLKELGGAVSGAKYITGTGGEVLPDGLDPKTIIVERSVPIAALDQALLVWEMNDEPLPISNGGPLRMVIPGYYGVNNIKYVKNIAFSEVQTDAKIQSSSYRIRNIGEKGAPSQPSMWEMAVKSWVTDPVSKAVKGRNLIYGVAFAGVNDVTKVEVSTDGGKNWREASFLGPDLGPYAWRPFVLGVDMLAGEYRIVSRATDRKGNVQPPERIENERGYGNTSWKDHGVTVSVS